ncbi:MAG: NYN domain-containing protein [Candidatus Gorgyraea atricola]|nr:NYN domain-containing protein [Candidatus Gorgyraea atricola]
MSKHLIIDGYNAINKIKELEAKKDISLEASRLHFIRILLDFMSKKRMFDKVSIVFDSKDKELGVRQEAYGNIEVVYGTYDKDADNVIVDMLRAASNSNQISVASDDNFVRNHARVYGSDAISISELKNIIMLKKRKSKSKIEEKELEGHKVKNINDELKKHWRLK